MDQAYYDNLYLQQVQQYENDQRAARVVNLLQGIAALLAIIVAIRLLMHKS